MNAPAETPEKADSVLAKFVKSIAGQKVNETDKKKAGADFKAFMGKKAKIEAQLEALAEEEDAIAKNAIRCFGRAKLNVDGVDYSPGCRGPRLYYKKMSGESVEL